MEHLDPDDLLTRLIDAVFRCNGALLAQGDALTAAVGLTAAQWQVLGHLADGPMTAAALAHRRGLRRQSVQETANRLSRQGLLTKEDNVHDRRAPLLTLTAAGQAALAHIEPLRAQWVQQRLQHLSVQELITTLHTIQRLTAEG